jgi:hypothetical protein
MVSKSACRKAPVVPGYPTNKFSDQTKPFDFSIQQRGWRWSVISGKHSSSLPSLSHCNENRIHVFPEKELRGLSPKFHIHVSVSDFNLPKIDPHIFPQQNRQTNCGNILYCMIRSQTHECGNWEYLVGSSQQGSRL